MRLTDTEVLLALIPYLQKNPGSKVGEVAARFGRTKRWLVKTLWELFVCGLPGDHIGGLIDIDMDVVEQRGEIYLIDADSLDRPVRLSAPEAVAVLAGLTSLRHAIGSSQRRVVDSAIAKTRQALGNKKDLAERVQVATVDSAGDFLDQVEHAVSQRRRILITHQRDAQPPRQRTVDPVALLFREGQVYLQAWDVDRDDWRTFRLDRITDVEDVGCGSDHGPTPAATWWEDDSEQVEVLLDPHAAWVVEKYPCEVVEQREDRWLVRLRVLDPQWLIRLLLQLGHDIAVVTPGDHHQQARQRAEAALAAYRELSPPATVGDIG